MDVWIETLSCKREVSLERSHPSRVRGLKLYIIKKKGIAEKPKPIIKTEIRMKRDRIKNGWSRPYLGRKWKVTGSCIQALEECKNKPSYDLLLKIMDTFGYTDPREPFEMVGIEEIETPWPRQ